VKEVLLVCEQARVRTSKDACDSCWDLAGFSGDWAESPGPTALPVCACTAHQPETPKNKNLNGVNTNQLLLTIHFSLSDSLGCHLICTTFTVVITNVSTVYAIILCLTFAPPPQLVALWLKQARHSVCW
jgi:hypothetical protein